MSTKKKKPKHVLDEIIEKASKINGFLKKLVDEGYTLQPPKNQ